MTLILRGTDNSASAPAVQGGTGGTTTGIYYPATNQVALATNGTVGLLQDANQNVGINNTPPTNYQSGRNGLYIGGTGSIDSYSPGSTSQVRVCANTYVNSSNAEIYRITAAASVYGQNAGVHAWYNAPSGTAGTAVTFTQAMTLDASGNLLVGTTDVSATTGSGIKIIKDRSSTSGYNAVSVVSNASSSAYSTYELYTAAGGAGYKFYVAYNGTISAVTTTITAISDQRLKENIRDLDDGLEKLMALKPRKFDWKEGKGANTKDARGFIAQEFEEVFPDMIQEWKDPAPEGEEPYKAVNANLIPTLVKAIQELKTEFDAYKAAHP
jgi:hypothetical protein